MDSILLRNNCEDERNMKRKKAKYVTAEYERALKQSEEEGYVLRLYTTGATTHSQAAVKNILQICEEHLQGKYDLQVIDVSQQPKLAAGEKIVAAPTLIKKLPLPIKRLIGDMSDTKKVLAGLNILKKNVIQAL